MNISYKWLKEYVDFDLAPQQVADALTSTGLEVDAIEEVQSIPGGLKGVVIGEVLTCEPHPNSDHMHITTVDLGKGEPQQIVCGAPNVAAGQKVVVADLGAVLHADGKEMVIKKAKLRGVESLGMICAEDEIGVGSSHDGIIVLPPDAVPGTPAAEYYHLESDWLIEIDLTANRADALSHYGVARDLYAWLLANGHETRLHRPGVEAFKVDDESLDIDVEIQNEEACRRYACVSLTGVEVKDSPEWLKTRLTTVGLRPINNIVDITNYIMLAYGQPLHCFDADMVKGRKIIVRTQPEGTKFITLDGEEHTLGAHDLSICNAEEAMAIAGIFGGKGSGTYETTRNVVLESACFHPTWIRKSARRHGLSTDASYRFERGVDPNLALYALKQAAILCRELAGGKVSMQIRDVYPRPVEPATVRLDYGYAHTLIGKELGAETIKRIARSLEMEVTSEDAQGIDLAVPTYRVDVQRPCDVVEDILRIYGYNNVEIPTQLKSTITTPEEKDLFLKLENEIGEQLVGAGFNEIMNNSLTKTAYYAGHNVYGEDTTVKVMNPLSQDLGVMRQTLLFGGLESILRNVNHKRPNLRFFEFGNCYHYHKEAWTDESPVKAYRQEQHLGLWLTGKRVQGSWAHPDEDSSFAELSAHVQNVFARVGLDAGAIALENGENDVFDKSLVAMSRGGKRIAEMGVVSRKLLKEFDIAQPVFFADIDWTALMKATKKAKTQYKDIAKYPAVSRDLALLINKSVSFRQIEDVARRTERKLLKRVELFDVYESDKLPEGTKSYAVNFILQDEGKTLNDKQIDAIMAKLIASIKKELGAELR